MWKQNFNNCLTIYKFMGMEMELIDVANKKKHENLHLISWYNLKIVNIITILF